jgi:hypothetical protein
MQTASLKFDAIYACFVLVVCHCLNSNGICGACKCVIMDTHTVQAHIGKALTREYLINFITTMYLFVLLMIVIASMQCRRWDG